MSDDANQFVEYLVIGGILDDMLAAGFSISINDGEETVIKRSTDKAAILAVMHSTDEDYIFCHGMPHNIANEDFKLQDANCYNIGAPDLRSDVAGVVRLIYGNEGAYVVNDYSTALTPWLDANDSQYQRWFRYIDDFKWGTPSPMDSKMATMRELLLASADQLDKAGEVLERPVIELTPAEVQSGYDRVKFAEGLIRQLPEDHDGRNTWLLNYGAKA